MPQPIAHFLPFSASSQDDVGLVSLKNVSSCPGSRIKRHSTPPHSGFLAPRRISPFLNEICRSSNGSKLSRACLYSSFVVFPMSKNTQEQVKLLERCILNVVSGSSKPRIGLNFSSLLATSFAAAGVTLAFASIRWRTYSTGIARRFVPSKERVNSTGDA